MEYICDECLREVNCLWLSNNAGKNEVPEDWYVCSYCLANESEE